MSPEFYEKSIQELDAVMSTAIRKELKKCARRRESTTNLKGSILDDWESIKKGYRDALNYILEATDSKMHIGGVLKHCAYVAIADEEKD